MCVRSSDQNKINQNLFEDSQQELEAAVEQCAAAAHSPSPRSLRPHPQPLLLLRLRCGDVLRCALRAPLRLRLCRRLSRCVEAKSEEMDDKLRMACVNLTGACAGWGCGAEHFVDPREIRPRAPCALCALSPCLWSSA